MAKKQDTTTIKATHTMGDGEQPEAVRVSVKQGPHTLQAKDVPPGDPAEFEVHDGDYTVTAQSLVPVGAEASASVAVPGRLTVEVVKAE